MKHFMAGMTLVAGMSCAVVAAPAGAAVTSEPGGGFDSAPFISSNVPTPGLFTAGRWSITNAASVGVIPAGSTYIVHFYPLGGPSQNGTGQATVSTYGGSRVEQPNVNTFRITLTKSLAPWQSVRGIWSEAQNLMTNRNGVSISLESAAAGSVDLNPGNDTSTYDNKGRGF